MKDIPGFPLYLIMSAIATFGGIARFANDYQKGKASSWRLFFASIFFSAFSGLIFGLLGIALNLPEPLIFAMTGTGGYFADQSLKLVMEFVSRNIK